jgi:hypothetical protein
VIIVQTIRVFGGVIDEVTETEKVDRLGENLLRVDCTCVDYTTILDRRMVTEAYRNQTVTQIVDDLLTNYLTAEGFWYQFPATGDGDEWYAMPAAWNPVGINEQSGIDASIASTNIDLAIALLEPASKIFDQIADLTGAIWYITPHKQIIITTSAEDASIDITDSASPTSTQTNRIQNVAVTRNREGYRNKQWVVSRVHRKEQFDGDGTRDEFDVEHPIIVEPEMTRWDIAADGTRSNEASRTVSDSGSSRTTIKSDNGEGFTNQPGLDAVDVVSSNAGDTTQTVTIIGVASGTNAKKEDVSLNGTTPVTTTEINWTEITAVKMDATAAGTVTISTNTGSLTIATIPDGDTSTGLSAVSVDDFYVKPVAVLDAAGTGLEELTLFGTTPSGSTLYSRVQLNGTTEVTFPSVYKNVTEMHVGDIATARTVTLSAPPEWVWTQYSTTVTHNTPYIELVSASQQIAIEYDGVRFLSSQGGEDIVEAEDATEISNRATAEGGTGKYENVETVPDRYTTNEAQGLADALISRFSDLPTHIRLETDEAVFRIGTSVEVTLSKHGVSATDYVLQGLRFHERDIPEGLGRKVFVWSLDLSSQNVTRDWINWFKRALDWRP